MPISESYLTVQQAARLANCCPTYLHGRARQGAITSKCIAGRIFIERESFMTWLEVYQIRRHINPVFAETVGA